MSIELAAYLAAGIAAFLCVIFYRSRAPLVLFALFYFTYYTIDRSGAFSVDLEKFSDWLTWKWDFTSTSVLREALFFLVGTTLYKLTASAKLAIVGLDIIAFTAILAAFYKVQRPGRPQWQGMVIYCMCFMTLLGSQNLYRQHLGTSMLMLAYAYAMNERKVSSTVMNIIGLFFHNSMVLGFPITVLRSWFQSKPGIWAISSLAGITLSAAALYIFSSGSIENIGKSNSSTGSNMAFAYIALLLLLWSMCLYLYRFNLVTAAMRAPALLLGSIITLVMSLLFNDAPAERVGAIFLILGILDIHLATTRLTANSARLIWIITLVVYFVPGLLFASTRQFFFDAIQFGYK